MIEITSDKLILTSAEILGNRWPYEQTKLRMFPHLSFIGAVPLSLPPRVPWIPSTATPTG